MIMLVTSWTIYGKVYCSAAAHTGKCLLSIFLMKYLLFCPSYLQDNVLVYIAVT